MADESEPLGCSLIILAIIGAGIWGMSKSGLVGEQNGTVKYDDCREIIQLPPDTFQKYYQSFTCDIQRTRSGKVMFGTCVRVESSGSTCTLAYVYDKRPDIKCTDPNYPNLGYDDLCHSR